MTPDIDAKCCPTCKRPYRQARLTDPDTSHQPSPPGVTSMAADILRLFYRLGWERPEGLTSWDVGQEMQINDDAARRRTSDLIRRGLIEPTGDTKLIPTGQRTHKRRLLRITDEGSDLVVKWKAHGLREVP